MQTLKGKKILLGVTGSIAAYKTAFLVRLLVKAGAEVQVLMTEAATAFITPLSLSTLSKRPVHTSVIDAGSWNNHVEMGLWADAMVIAPVTATTLAKMASGLSDNIIVATYLSARCPVFFAPAMDLDMWAHPATRENVRRLQSYGNTLIPVGHGELASGLSGDGRMAEPEDIVELLATHFAKADQPQLIGKEILITAGPTYEAIDPVRFIGNRSSGKMGVAIAEVCAARGASVQLVLGPSKLEPRHANIVTTRVESAQEMYEAATQFFGKMDAAILAAAVADYRPATVADQKIKKKSSSMAVQLEKTPDIAASLGAVKKDGQTIIGFALETNNEVANAKAKIEKKNFDYIVLNSLRDKGAGFNHDTNKVSIISRKGVKKDFELKSKTAVAEDIVDTLIAHWSK
ncbi:MAG: bifunctional phosphopantothenoylcysteine decarboxylase/phosphopantothenate--cysteine ligase CoaBC [Bacteroidota bacterium]